MNKCRIDEIANGVAEKRCHANVRGASVDGH